MALRAKNPDPWRDEFYVRAGRRIRHWRGVRGIRQRDLADAVGLTRCVLTNIEAGRQRIPVDLFWRIAAALKVAPKTLMPRLASSRAALREQRLAQRVEGLS